MNFKLFIVNFFCNTSTKIEKHSSKEARTVRRGIFLLLGIRLSTACVSTYFYAFVEALPRQQWQFNLIAGTQSLEMEQWENRRRNK